MSLLFNPRLINSSFGDPGLFVPFFYQKRGLLFDLGDISTLSPKDILKITHCFVTHTHMDHFIGFDRLLRVMLGREKELYLFGPKGFHDNVAGKLAGYTWNLVENYDTPITLVVTEVLPDRRITKRYACKNRFLPTDESDIRVTPPRLYDEKSFCVETAILDHDIPCLGFTLKEHFQVNIRKEMLEKLDLEPGKWLYDFKQMIHDGCPPEWPVPALKRETGKRGTGKRGSGRYETFELGELTDRLAIIRNGRKIAYITDVAGTRENIERIVGLVKNCDHLFIEATFLEKHRRQAELKKHLTAYQAGYIAAEAGVGRFTLFHFSPRYEGSEAALRDEAMAGFKETLRV